MTASARMRDTALPTPLRDPTGIDVRLVPHDSATITAERRFAASPDDRAWNRTEWPVADSQWAHAPCAIHAFRKRLASCPVCSQLRTAPPVRSEPRQPTSARSRERVMADAKQREDAVVELVRKHGALYPSMLARMQGSSGGVACKLLDRLEHAGRLESVRVLAGHTWRRVYTLAGSER